MGCQVKTQVVDGIMVDVKPNPDSPYGHLCPIGKCAPKIIYANDRIKKPLIRNGRKGTCQFREASWDEALGVVASGLQAVKTRYGANATASYMGRGTLEDSLSTFGDTILKAFGSPNDMDCGSICYVSSRIIAPKTTLGIGGRHIVADCESADTIVVWGANPGKDCPPLKFNQIMAAKRRGAKLIVIDPRRNKLAQAADLWIPVRPGTDGALALVIANIAIQRKAYDKEFVENWTVGFEEFTQYVSTFAPERASALCHVRENDLLELAQALAFPTKTAWFFYTGLEYAPSAVQNVRALYVLAAITGNIDTNGGLYIDDYPIHEVKESAKSAEAERPIGAREYPMFYGLTGRGQFVEFPKAVLEDDPYPVRSLLLIGGSPTTSYPCPELWHRVYQRLEFMTVIDRFMTSECIWSDVVLPATTHYEKLSYHHYPSEICIRERAIDPIGQARNDVLIIAQIADRLGYGDLYPQNEQEILKRAFHENPALLQELMGNHGTAHLPECALRYKKYKNGFLRSDGKPGFPTESGKFEISSSLLYRYGYPSIPVYTDPYSSECDGIAEDYPLALTTGARSLYSQNSQYLNISELTAMQPHPLLEINPKDAAKLNIQDGERVWLKTAHGQIHITAFVTPNIGVGTVHAPFGGGNAGQVSAWREFNINALVDYYKRDPISGYVVNKAIRCRVEK
jgi:anaerobic selenocysteine-containing dehydrogenase